jgi:hypothetical protein
MLQTLTDSMMFKDADFVLSTVLGATGMTIENTPGGNRAEKAVAGVGRTV